MVTTKCNLHCHHCRPGGEGYFENPNKIMTSSEINKVTKISSEELGITHVKFTGGEPLLRPDILRIIENTKKINQIKDVRLVTNGTKLNRYANSLKDAGLDAVTVSVDAVNDEVYKMIRGIGLNHIKDGLHLCKTVGLPVRINTVLMKSNASQVEGLINLASEVGASLKFIDLMDVNNDPKFWQREFYPFTDLRNTIERLGALYQGYEEATGGIGAPLLRYIMPNSLNVLLRDALEGAFYTDLCHITCKYYPCQDGVMSLRLTHDGHLKKCLIRNDNLVDILTPLKNGDNDKVRTLIQESLNILAGAKYFPHAWQPRIMV